MKLTPLLFFCFISLATAAQLNYSTFDDYTSTQGHYIPLDNTTNLGQQYYEIYNGGTFGNCASGAWVCATGAITKLAYPAINLQPSGSTGNDIAFYSRSYAGNLTINGSVYSTISGAGNGIDFFITRYNPDDSLNATLYQYTFLNATAYLQTFTLYNIAIAPRQKIRLMADCKASCTNDQLAISNVTITGAATMGVMTIYAVFDENIITTNKTYELTIANNTNSTSYGNITYTSFNRSLADLPTGQITITATNNSCLTGNVIPRKIETNTANGASNLTMYLLCDGSTPIFTTIYVQNLQQARIPGAEVTAYKTINGQNKVMTSAITDGVGAVNIYLDINMQYLLNITAPGYLPSTGYLQPTAGTYTITLAASNATIGFSTPLDGLYYQIQPQTSYLFGNYSNASFYINDTQNALLSWGWNLTYNGAAIYNYLNTTTNGGYDAVNINLTNRTGNITAFYWFYRYGYPIYLFNRTLLINPVNITNQTLVVALAQPQQDGASNTLIVIVCAVLISIAITPIVRFMPSGSGIIVLILWSIITFTGGITTATLGLDIVGVLCYYALTKV